MESSAKPQGSYKKRPLWQWLVIYLSLGAIIYGGVYYFVLSKRGGPSPYLYSKPTPVEETQSVISRENGEPTTAITNPSETKEISIILTKDGFSPKILTVKTGTKVTWLNQSENPATVNSSPHPAHTDYPALNLGSFGAGESLSLTFNKPGTYKYHNHLNSSQFGNITVE